MINKMIYNLPDSANAYKYVVVNDIDGDLWYYGAWDDKARAEEVAIAINGLVITH